MSPACHELIGLLRPSAEAPDLPEGCRAVSCPGGLLAVLGERPQPPRPGRSRRAIGRAVGQATVLRQTRLEALLPCGDLLPAHPGTAPPDDLAGLVVGNADQIARAFQRIAGLHQLQVAVSWDRRHANERFGLAGGRIDDLATAFAHGILGRLAGAAEDMIEMPRDEGGLANAVVLVRPDRAASLDGALEAIDRIWTEGLLIRVIGPTPAISFARLQLEAIEGGDALRAAALLDVDAGSVPVSAEIDLARKRSLRRSLQDPVPAPDEIARAATILTLCAQLRVAPRALGPATLAGILRDGPAYQPSPSAALPEVA